MIDFLLGWSICLSAVRSLPLVRFGQLLRCADTCIVNILKAYIKRMYAVLFGLSMRPLGSLVIWLYDNIPLWFKYAPTG